MITVFLPCRSGSQRIPQKNTKQFAGINGGLLTIKLNQLLKVEKVDKIILSTDDDIVKKIGSDISDKIIIDNRPIELALSSTSTDEVINYIPTIIKEGHVLWTHVTSPFLDETIYAKAINIYLDNIEKKSHDSLMTVNNFQSFLWDEKGSFNYDRRIEKWPRTQTLNKLYEINSGIFINSIDNYINLKDRIGNKPYLMETEGFSSFDIDWPDDFLLGELIFNKLNNQNQ